jgi:hypothetical protein
MNIKKIKHLPVFATIVASTVILAAAGLQKTSAAPAMIFCNGNMATPAGLTTSQINGYRASGMNTMVIFTMDIQANGDFTYAGLTLCSGGSYVGPANYASLLNQCKAAPSSVTRIEMCTGGWGAPSFPNIKSLIASQGNNTGNILYRNLAALHANLPINAIDFDDETTYDSASAVAFGGMAGALGMKVTLCPYTNPGFWQAVKSGLGGYCDAVYLQCYDGGAGNNPATWDSYFGGGFKVIPGYWDAERDTTLLTKMQAWSQSQASAGGFLWPSCSGCNPPAGGDELLQNAGWIHQAMDMPQGVYYVGSYGQSGKALQGTLDPYYNGSSYAPGCDEVALTPFISNSYQSWSVIPTGGGQYHIMNHATGQLLQSTHDPYIGQNGAVGGCNKVALTPAYLNNANQTWQIPPAAIGYAIANPANSQYLRGTLDPYAYGCYKMAGIPYAWGVSGYDEWNLVWVSN